MVNAYCQTEQLEAILACIRHLQLNKVGFLFLKKEAVSKGQLLFFIVEKNRGLRFAFPMKGIVLGFSKTKNL